MILFVPTSELEPPYNEPERLEYLRNVGIDYATNTIDAVDYGEIDEFGNAKCISFFNFSNWDIRFANRFHDYQISCGPAGITFNFTCTKPNETR